MRQRTRRYTMGRLIVAEALDLFSLVRQFYRVLIAFGTLWLAGAAYLAVHLAITFPAALYQMLRLMAFQNSDPLPANDHFLAAMYFVVPVVAVVIFLPNVLSFGRQAFDKATRLADWQNSLAATYRGHVIVCGVGRVGIRVITGLVDAHYDVVAITEAWDAAFVPRALALRVPVI